MYDVIISRLISKETKTNRKSNLTRLDRKMKGIWKGDHSCSSSLQTDTKLAQNCRLSFAMNTTKPEWGNCFSTSDVVVRSVCKVRAGRWRGDGGRAFVDLGVRLSQMKRWFLYEFTSSALMTHPIMSRNRDPHKVVLCYLKPCKNWSKTGGLWELMERIFQQTEEAWPSIQLKRAEHADWSRCDVTMLGPP